MYILLYEVYPTRLLVQKNTCKHFSEKKWPTGKAFCLQGVQAPSKIRKAAWFSLGQNLPPFTQNSPPVPRGIKQYG